MNRFLTLLLAPLAFVPLNIIAAPTESDFYRIDSVPIPEGVPFEVSGMQTLPDGRLAVTIRKGEIWFIGGLDDPKSEPTFHKFAEALHEPLGLLYKDDAFYVAQRSEVTKIRDLDGDDIADEYLTFAKGWGVSGNYHEYAYGPEIDGNGDLWVSLNISIGAGRFPDSEAWRGWGIRLGPDGTLNPSCTGMRSPCGLGVNLAGDMFFTDQQGNWFGTCGMFAMADGAFYGHVDGLESADLPGSPVKRPEKIEQNIPVYQAARQIEGFKLPAIWFPYRKMGMGSTDILLDTTDGKFGPFADQLFVGDFTMSMISRVDLEKVGGEWQGACFPFRSGFQSAVLRLEWAPNGSLFVGETNRGWNSLGNRSYGLERLTWTGKTPIEVLRMNLRPDGFRLHFTQPVHHESAADVSNYSMESYTYMYHLKYGSDEVEKQELTIKQAHVADDRLSVVLDVEGLREGFVHELHLPGLKSATGEPLLHPVAYYTLNNLKM